VEEEDAPRLPPRDCKERGSNGDILRTEIPVVVGVVEGVVVVVVLPGTARFPPTYFIFIHLHLGQISSTSQHPSGRLNEHQFPRGPSRLVRVKRNVDPSLGFVSVTELHLWYCFERHVGHVEYLDHSEFLQAPLPFPWSHVLATVSLGFLVNVMSQGRG
jgi:hypothetical protein